MDWDIAIDQVFEPEPKSQGLKRKDVQSNAWQKAFGYKPVKVIDKAIDKVYGKEEEKPEYGLLRLAGRGLAEGITTELPGMVGRTIQFLTPDSVKEKLGDPGKALAEWADSKAVQWYGNKPDNLSLLETAVYEGTKMLSPSIVPAGMIGIGTRILLGIGNTMKAMRAAELAGDAVRAAELLTEANKAARIANTVASAGTAGIFGLSQAQQTYDTAIERANVLQKQGKIQEADEMRKKAEGLAPYLTGAIEATGEYLGTKYLGKLFGLSEAEAIRRGMKELASDFVKTLGVEVGTEIGQQYGEAEVEKRTGIRPEANPLREALEVIGPTSFMTLITGGFGASYQTAFGRKSVEDDILDHIQIKSESEDPAFKKEVSDKIAEKKKEAVKDIKDDLFKAVKKPIPAEEPTQPLTDKMLEEEVKKVAEAEEQKAFHEGDILKTDEAKETIKRATKALKKAKREAGKTGEWMHHNALKETIRKAKLPNTENRKKSLRYLWETYASELPEPAEIRTHFVPEEPERKVEGARGIRKDEKKIEERPPGHVPEIEEEDRGYQLQQEPTGRGKAGYEELRQEKEETRHAPETLKPKIELPEGVDDMGFGELKQLFRVPKKRLASGEWKNGKNIGRGDIQKSYSADTLMKDKIRKPFIHNDNLYVQTGSYGGSGGPHTAYRLETAENYKGKTFTYSTTPERHGYEGHKIKYKGKEYVLTDKTIFISEEKYPEKNIPKPKEAIEKPKEKPWKGILYHGSDTGKGRGVSYTPDKEYAQAYGKKVSETKLKPNSKILVLAVKTPENLWETNSLYDKVVKEKYRAPEVDIGFNPPFMELDFDAIKKDGYDAVVFPDDGALEVRVLNKDALEKPTPAPEKTEVAPERERVEKESWKMSQAEFVEDEAKKYKGRLTEKALAAFKEHAKSRHRNDVLGALNQGKPVPESVLKEYRPEKPKVEVKEETGEEQRLIKVEENLDQQVLDVFKDFVPGELMTTPELREKLNKPHSTDLRKALVRLIEQDKIFVRNETDTGADITIQQLNEKGLSAKYQVGIPHTKLKEIQPGIETKKEKSLREYNEYVAGLTDEQKALAGDLIVEEPEYPSQQKRKIEKKIKKAEPKPTPEAIEQGEKEYEEIRDQAVEQVGEDVVEAVEIEADAAEPAKEKPKEKVKRPRRYKKADYPVFIDMDGKEYSCYGYGVHVVKTGPNRIGGTGWEWYAFEPIKGDIAFGLVHGFETEWGSFSLSELKENGVLFKTDPKDLHSIMPPVDWTKKEVEKPEKPLTKQVKVAIKEEEKEPETKEAEHEGKPQRIEEYEARGPGYREPTGRPTLGKPSDISAREPAPTDLEIISGKQGIVEEPTPESRAEGKPTGVDLEGRGETRGRPDQGIGPEDRSAAGRRAAAKTPEGRAIPESPELEPKPELKEEDHNHVIEPEDTIFPRGDETRIKANITAITLLKKLEKENRNPSIKEKKVLAQYVGWGPFAQKVFNRDYDKYLKQSYPDRTPEDHFIPYWDKNDRSRLEKYEAWANKYGKKLHPKLGGILTEKEWDLAAESTLNAFYTSREVINSMWTMAEKMGFKGGTILEPAIGIGHFFGLIPQNIAENSSLLGIDIDSISARISTKLYPQAFIQESGYEKAKRIPDNSIDLVITNVPFGNFSVYDPKHKEYTDWAIHNYYFARSIDAVRPGGLVMGITSHWTLDAATKGYIREELSKKADLVAAIRMPYTAFKKDTGTEVTTDILIFRKKDAASHGLGKEFRVLKNVEAEKDKTAAVNEYFVDHPEMVLGKHSLSGTMRGGEDEYTLLPSGDFEAQLKNVVDNLPEDIAGEGRKLAMEEVQFADTGAKEGTLTEKDNKFYVVEDGLLKKPKVYNSKGKLVDAIDSKAKEERANNYLKLRDATKNVIERMQDHEATDEEITELRNNLNKIYDKFTKKYNNIGASANAFLRKIDNEFPIVDALEDEDISTEKTTVKSGPNKGLIKTKKIVTFTKAAILKKRTIWPFREPDTAENLDDAVKIARIYKNKIDTKYIAKLLSIKEEEARKQILASEKAYINPETGILEAPDVYLSGNVKKKLEKAKIEAKENKDLEKNVKALEAVQPDDLDIQFIHFKLGSSWLPNDTVKDFLQDVMGVNADIEQVRTGETSSWGLRPISGHWAAKNKETWGTKRKDGHELVQDCLNLKRTTVMDYWKEDGKRRQAVNKEESTIAQAKQAEIQAEFLTWARNHKKWGDELAKIYNAEFNGSVLRKWEVPDIDHYPGASTDIVLRPLQKKAVSRGLQESTLLAYGVGTGKTFAYISLAMEMRRIGTAKKPLIVVQNATIRQYAKDFKRLYPQAKVLIPIDGQRKGKNRKKLLSQIATGDWDAVVLPHSFFDGIADDPEREAAFVQEQLDMIEEAIDEFEDSEGKSSFTVKDMKALRKRKEQRLEKLLDRRKDDALTFEQLGVDALLVDEAHTYKRSEFFTKMGQVKGIDQGSAQKSTSLLLKSNYVRQKTGGKNIILATGTPISNTTAELWTMMRYIRPDLLEDFNAELFDDFAANFGDTSITTEETDTGTFKEVERFNKYVNGPELLTMFHTAADVVLTEDANLDLPKMTGGKPQEVLIQRSEDLTNFIDLLREQRQAWENLTGKEKREQRHVPLVIFGQARKAAVDLRLIDPNYYKDDPNSKLNQVSNKVFEIWKETRPNKSTQVVFLDMFRHSSGRFNAHEDIKQKLIDKGVPSKEIIVVSDTTDIKRESWFKSIREGKARVIIGTTPRLGIGVNIQDKLIAAHHVDAPMRPMDIEQRNGRIVREKNENSEVMIFNYGVKNTLDSVMYDRLMKKQRFIDQMLTGDIEGRTFDEPLSEEQISFAEMNAAFAGNPLLFEKSDVNIKIKNFRVLKNSWQRQISHAIRDSKIIEDSTLPRLNKELHDAIENKELIENKFPDKTVETVEYNGEKLERKEFIKKATEELESIKAKLNKKFSGMAFGDFDKAREKGEDIKHLYAKFHGFDLEMSFAVAPENYDSATRIKEPSKKIVLEPDIIKGVKSTIRYKGDVIGTTNTNTIDGLFRSLRSSFERIIKEPNYVRKAIERKKADLEELKKVAKAPYKYESELKAAEKRMAEIDEQLQKGLKELPAPKEQPLTKEQAERKRETLLDNLKNDLAKIRNIDEEEGFALPGGIHKIKSVSKVFDYVNENYLENYDFYKDIDEDDLSDIKDRIEKLKENYLYKEHTLEYPLHIGPRPQYQIGKSVPIVGDQSLVDLLRKSPPLRKMYIGLSNDGSVWIRNQKGNGFQVKSVKFIEPDRAALQIGHGRMLKNGEFVKGKYQDGIIELQRDLADEWTLTHESMHFAEDLGFVSGKDVQILKNHIRKLERNGKWDSQGREVGGAEDRAIYATQFMRDRAIKGKVGKILQKIADFVDAIVNIFHRTSRGILRGIESGRAFEGRTTRGRILIPAYEKTAQRWYSQMQNVLEQKLPGKGTPESYTSTIEGFARKGEFKQEELEWSGVLDWLKEQSGKVTKQQVLDYLDQNNVRVEEVEKAKGTSLTFDDLNREIDWPMLTGDDYEGYWTNPHTDETVTFRMERQGDGSYNLYINDELEYENEREQDARDYAQAEIDSVMDQWEALGEPMPESEYPGETKFSQYTLPGGENYRELLLTLPLKKSPKVDYWDIERSITGKHIARFDTYEEAKRYAIKEGLEPTSIEIIPRRDEGLVQVDVRPEIEYRGYISSHWEEPNVLAHVRFDDRTGPNGEKILHIAEIQSDWHQEGRKKGYISDDKLPPGWTVKKDTRPGTLNPWLVYNQNDVPTRFAGPTKAVAIENAIKGHGIPDAPFKKTWPLLTIKRMVRYAAENGYDAISWDTGEVQADRYQLGNYLNLVEAQKDPENENIIRLTAWDKNDRIVLPHVGQGYMSLELQRLPDYVGKELADKILTDTYKNNEKIRYSGLDLHIGGEGMKSFYDRLLPNEVNKFFNKKTWGKAAVGSIDISGELNLPKGWYLTRTVNDNWQVRDEDDYVNATGKTEQEAIKNALKEIGKPTSTKIEVHSLTITPEMRSKALAEGMPMFDISTVAEPELRKSTNRFIQKGRLNKKAFFDRTSIELPSSDPKDLIRGFRWFQTMQDMAKNFPNMRRLFDVEKKRVSESNFASISDRETTEPYFTLDKESRNKVNQALFDGDENSEVYNDRQLKEEFGLNNEEIAGYQSIRTVLDEKLDDVIRRILTDVIDTNRTPITDEIVSDIKKSKTEEELRDVLMFHYISEYEANKLPWLVNWLKEFQGYIPHKWDAEWLVRVELDEDNEYMFEVPAIGGRLGVTRKARQKSAKEVAVQVIKEKLNLSNEAIRKLAKDGDILVVRSRDLPIDLFEGARMDVIQSIINDAQEKMWQETIQYMTEDQAEKFKDMQKILRGHIEEMYLAKGWGRHLMGRRGVKGYRTDLENVISSYLIGANKFKAKGEAAKGFAKVMKDISPTKTPEQWKHGKQYVSDMLGESSEAGWFKKIAGTWFLAGDLSAAALNMTQNWTHAVPLLRSIKPKKNRMIAERELFLAMKDIAGEYARTRGKDKKLFSEASKFINQDEIAALHKAYGEGHLDPAFLGETTGYRKNKIWQDYSQKIWDVMFKLFTGAEGWNRTSTFLASYRRAKRSGMTDNEALDKAVEIVEGAHFTYGRGNRPQAVRATGALGNVMYTFMTYPLNNLVFLKHRTEDLLNDLHKGNKEAVKTDMKVLGSNLGYVFAFGGLMGLPFAYLAQSVLNLFDDDDEDWEILMRKHMPKTIGRAVTRGIPAAFLGNDMSWRVQGTDVIGMPIGFQIAKMGKQRLEKAYELWNQGDEIAAVFYLMPDMVRNPYRSVVGYKEGGTRVGVPPIKYTTGEAITKALSFTPTREAEAWKAGQVVKRAREVRLENLENFAERYLIARKEKDREAVIELRKELQEYNRRQKKKDRKGLRITWKDVTKSARLRRKSRGKAYREHIPKYMRRYRKNIEESLGLE